MYTDNINLTDLFYFEVKEKCFAICVIVISFTFNEALSCQKCSLYCLCSATTPEQLLQTSRLQFWGNENTGSASNDYIQLRCTFYRNHIETLSKVRVRLFWYPKNIPGRFCSGKEVLNCFTVPFMFPSINCEFIYYESL